MEVVSTIAVWLLAISLQMAGQEGTVSGSLTLNGRTVALTHVYASAHPGFFDKTTEDVHVLLSDASLPDAARGDVFELMKLARQGSATIVEVVIDAGGAPISGSFFAKEFDGMVSATGMHVFTKREVTRTRFSGRLATSSERSFANVTFKYDATFDAPIPRPPTDAEKKAALATPPARAASAYLAALLGNRLQDFLQILTTEAASDFRGAAGAERFRQLRADTPTDIKVVDVVPQTNGSVLVTTEGHAGGIAIEYPLVMVLDAGTWKVGR